MFTFEAYTARTTGTRPATVTAAHFMAANQYGTKYNKNTQKMQEKDVSSLLQHVEKVVVLTSSRLLYGGGGHKQLLGLLCSQWVFLCCGYRWGVLGDHWVGRKIKIRNWR